MPILQRTGHNPRVATLGIVIGALCLAISGCATWDTSEIDSTTTTVPKVYTADEAGLNEAFVDVLTTDTSSLSDWAPPEDQAECAAKKLVDRFGVERLLDIGFDVAAPSIALDYEGAEVASAINILDGCLDVETGLLEVYSSYGKLSLASTSCLTRNLERAGMTRTFVSGVVTGDEPDPFGRKGELSRELARVAGECLDDVDLIPTGPLAPIPESGQPESPGTSLVDPDIPTTTIDDLLVIEE